MAGGHGFWLPLLGEGGGGAGGVSLISAVTLTSSGVITFSSIPTGFAALQVIASVRSTRVSTTDELVIRMGSGSVDTGAVYRYASRRTGFDNIAQSSTAGTEILTTDGVPGASANAADFASFDAKLTGYDDAARYTSMLWMVGTDPPPYMSHGGATHLSAVAVDILTIDAQNGDLTSGSKAWLYGWAGE